MLLLELRQVARRGGAFSCFHTTQQSHRPPRQCHSFSSSSKNKNSEDAYLEAWQAQQIKSPSFYAQAATHRHWFYTIDLQGRLYLEESRVKNLTSCLKDNKFLNFFFKQVRHNTTGLYPEYPFISPCGKEINYILPADMPLVYHDLHFFSQEEEEEGKGKRKMKGMPSSIQAKEKKNEERAQLVYGGDLTQPFDPAAMHVSLRSGRLYHPLPPTHPPTQRVGGKGEEGRRRPRFGLLRSHIGLLLADRMVHVEEEKEEEEGGLVLVWGEEERRYPVKVLPEEEEPVWGLLPPPSSSSSSV